MNILELIHLYEKWKEAHEPLGYSLAEKMRALRRGFGSMPATASGEELAKRARQEWPNSQASTLSRILRQLRAVFNHAVAVGVLPRAPKIPLPSVYDTQPQILTGAQTALLLDTVKAAAPWAYPAVLLLSHTGGRLGEAMGVDVTEDLRSDGVAIVKRTARKSKTVTRIIPYTPRLREAVVSGLFKASPFVSSTGVPMRSSKVASAAIGRVLRDCCERAGLPKINPHALRHAFAGIVAEHGGSLEDIAALLGHTNTTMAMRYRGLVKHRAEAVLHAVAG